MPQRTVEPCLHPMLTTNKRHIGTRKGAQSMRLLPYSLLIYACCAWQAETGPGTALLTPDSVGVAIPEEDDDYEKTPKPKK